MAAGHSIRRFFLPSLTPVFLLRIVLVALLAYLFFGHVCIPLRIHGGSMEPTYGNGSINFCWRLKYRHSGPGRGDVVVIRLAGQRVMLLKRVVALEGEMVEFRKGTLYVDGRKMEETYVRTPCDWNLPPRLVEEGHLYVVGDNRNMPVEQHDFGQVSIKRVVGGPLW